MTAAETILAELVRCGIELRVHGDRLRYCPRSAMTVELAERIRSHKAELLAILAATEGVDTLTVDTILETPRKNANCVNTDPVNSPTEPGYADREIERFMSVAVPWPDGRGWYDPAYSDIIEALALAEHDQPMTPVTGGRQPDLYPRPDGGYETFVERADRYRKEKGLTNAE